MPTAPNPVSRFWCSATPSTGSGALRPRQQVLVLCNPINRFWCSATPPAGSGALRPCQQVLVPCDPVSRFWCSATLSAGSGALRPCQQVLVLCDHFSRFWCSDQSRLSQVLTPRTCFTFAPVLHLHLFQVLLLTRFFFFTFVPPAGSGALQPCQQVLVL